MLKSDIDLLSNIVLNNYPSTVTQFGMVLGLGAVGDTELGLSVLSGGRQEV